MKLYTLLEKLPEYFYPIKDIEDAKKYIKQFDYYHYQTNPYHPHSCKTTKMIAYQVDDKNFNKSNEELILYYEQYCKALFRCLNISEDSILPTVTNERIVGTKEDITKGALIGAGVGAVLGAIFTGGFSILLSGAGAIVGSIKNSGDDKLTASCKRLYDNSKIMGDKCIEYFEPLIKSLINKGVVNTFIEPEYALYDVKKTCPICKKKLKAVKGKYGWFMSCCGYPECTYSTKYMPVPKINRSE